MGEFTSVSRERTNARAEKEGWCVEPVSRKWNTKGMEGGGRMGEFTSVSIVLNPLIPSLPPSFTPSSHCLMAVSESVKKREASSLYCFPGTHRNGTNCVTSA